MKAVGTIKYRQLFVMCAGAISSERTGIFNAAEPVVFLLRTGLGIRFLLDKVIFLNYNIIRQFYTILRCTSHNSLT